MTLKLTALSAFVLASPLLVVGGQSMPARPDANQPPARESAAYQSNAQSQDRFTCEADRTVASNNYRPLEPGASPATRADYIVQNDTACGYDTLAPVQQDLAAFQK